MSHQIFILTFELLKQSCFRLMLVPREIDRESTRRSVDRWFWRQHRRLSSPYIPLDFLRSPENFCFILQKQHLITILNFFFFFFFLTRTHLLDNYSKIITLMTVRGWGKSLPPARRKPHGLLSNFVNLTSRVAISALHLQKCTIFFVVFFFL